MRAIATFYFALLMRAMHLRDRDDDRVTRQLYL